MTDNFKQFRFDARQSTLNVAAGPPSGPPLVLLHGATSWWQAWRPVLPYFCATHQVFAIDMRGYGQSTHTQAGYGVMDMAGDIAAFLREIPEKPVHLLGHSFGGHVALATQALANDMVSALILEDIPLLLQDNKLVGKPAGPGFADSLSMVRAYHQGGREFSFLVDAVQKMSPENSQKDSEQRALSLSLLDPRCLQEYVDGEVFTDYAPDNLLRNLRVPALLLAADPDCAPRIEPHEVARATKIAPDMLSLSLRGTGHNVHADDPVNFAETVSGFLRALPGE